MRGPGRRTVRRAGTAAALVLVLAGGCGLINDKGDDDVETRREADVTRQVQEYADGVAALVGGPLVEPATSSAPCSGRAGEMDESIRYVQGAYQVELPGDRHVSTLARIRDHWRADGWTITEERTYPGGTEGTLTARTAPDGWSVSLTSTTPPRALALLIHSTCYRSADPV